MSIALNIIDILKGEMERHDAARLKGVKLKIGELTAVEPDSLKFCFETLTEGTNMEGTTLTIEEISLKAICSICNAQFKLDRYFTTPCPKCGGKPGDLLSGRELDIVSMEIE